MKPRLEVIELGVRVAACLGEENHGGGRPCGWEVCAHPLCRRRRAAVTDRARRAILDSLARLGEELGQEVEAR